MRRLALAPLLALLALGLQGCGRGEPDAEQQSPTTMLDPSDIAIAERAALRTGVVLTGTLDPFRVVEVRAQVPGTISTLVADRGDRVRRGQLLARIEAEGITSQASSARASVAAAEANLAQARRQLESARTLYQAGAMSELDFQAAQAALEAAQAQVATARAQAAGAVEQAGRTAIRAPIDGEVSLRAVSEGESVTPGDTLFTVVDSSMLELEGQVPVDQAAHVREGQPVEFELGAYPNRTFRGVVSLVAPVADPATRQVGLEMRLPNRDRELIAGLFATGRVITGEVRDALVIPLEAVRGTGERDRAYVWVIDNGQAARRDVELGPRDESAGLVAVAGGLLAGDTVVVSPGELSEGMRVELRQVGSRADGS